jgi:hypothetical protein
VAPEAVNVTLDPLVIEAEDGVTEMLGKAVIVTLAEELFTAEQEPNIITAR